MDIGIGKKWLQSLPRAGTELKLPQVSSRGSFTDVSIVVAGNHEGDKGCQGEWSGQHVVARAELNILKCRMIALVVEKLMVIGARSDGLHGLTKKSQHSR